MSASRESKKRQNLSGLTEKQKKDAIEAQKKKIKTIAYAIIGGVAAVAVIALLVWDNGVVQRNLTAYTIGTHKYKAADVDYFYYTAYNNYYSSYGSYLFSSDTSLKEQVLYTDDDGNDVTWHSMLMDDAINSLTSMTVLYDQAQAAGFTLSDDDKATIDSTMDSLKTTAETYGVDESYYLQQMYGKYMTAKKFKKIVTMYTLASEYSTSKYNEFSDAVTDDEINTYLADYPDQLDTFDYSVYYVDGTAETTTDEDGNTVEATDEETQAAMDAASALADELQADIDANDTDAVSALISNVDNGISDYGEYQVVGSSVSSSYASFVTDPATQEGDTSVIEASSGYYVVQFHGSWLDEYYPVTYRDILITAETDDDSTVPTDEQLEAAKSEAEALMDGITDEDTFADQVAGNSDDSSTSSNGGLNETQAKSDVSDSNIEQWLFDEEHTAGDMQVIEAADGTGYYLVYFVGYDDHYVWQNTASSSLASDAYDAWYTEVSADVTGTKGAGYGCCGDN